MADEYVENVNWFSRLGESIKGVLIGLLLLVISFPLLFWNEGRAVHTEQSLKEGAGAVRTVSADKTDPANNGKLIHMIGPATTTETLKDSEFPNVSAQVIALHTTYEMYQWKEVDKGKDTSIGGTEHRKYAYEKAWSPAQISSDSFHNKDPKYRNPKKPDNRDAYAATVTVGGFTLDDRLKRQIDSKEKLPVTQEMLPEDDETYRVSDGMFWKGDPANPRVGDVRVSFEVTKPTTVSLVAQQRDASFEPYQAKAGDSIEMLTVGEKSAAEMFKAAQETNAMMTWILRFVGWLLMFIGLCAIFAPIQTFASVIPFVGDVLGFGTGIFAFIISASLSLMTIAIAWIAYRPLLGIGLLVASVAIFVLVKQAGGKRKTA